MNTGNTSPQDSIFSPMRHTVFAVLWAATVLGNTGTFLRDVASAWLVTDLSTSPAAVAAIQAAGTLPIFLFAIPAGVLADVLDRRKLLIAIQILLLGVSAALCALAYADAVTIPLLLGLTFVGGIAAALMGPTWQSIVPDLVPRADLRNAIALNSLGINISRSIGPAVGGVLIASFGAAVTYGVDIATYVLVIAALLWWPRPAVARDELAEGFGGALRAGFRYARNSRDLHVVLWRAFFFFAFGSAIWAMLPLIARTRLGGDAAFYGVMLGAVGAGAILGALVLPNLRRRLGADALMPAAALLIALSIGALALDLPRGVALALLLVVGAAWITALTTLNSTAQGVLPNWVRGRGLAIYLTVFNGAMAAGSLAWGFLAQATSIPIALMASAAGLTVVSLILWRLPLPSGLADLSPSNHWPEPVVATPVETDRGPVLVLLEYRVEPASRANLVQALQRHASIRRRDGAFNWGVVEDAADPDVILEWFMTESWAEHLRQHGRATRSDADLHAALMAVQTGGIFPTVRHLISIGRKAG
jgi:MFS family permease